MKTHWFPLLRPYQTLISGGGRQVDVTAMTSTPLCVFLLLVPPSEGLPAKTNHLRNPRDCGGGKNLGLKTLQNGPQGISWKKILLIYKIIVRFAVRKFNMGSTNTEPFWVFMLNFRSVNLVDGMLGEGISSPSQLHPNLQTIYVILCVSIFMFFFCGGGKNNKK